jgi:poly-beta-1,6-N-acetyl-D-glucosamine synthase
MTTFFLWLHVIWETMLGYIFFYPLFMSTLWMIGAIFFYFKNEKPFLKQKIPLLEENESWPGVSIIIPCYNESENVYETMEYALNVEYPEFEVIAVNDGSKDDTLAKLLDIAQNTKL